MYACPCVQGSYGLAARKVHLKVVIWGQGLKTTSWQDDTIPLHEMELCAAWEEGDQYHMLVLRKLVDMGLWYVIRTFYRYHGKQSQRAAHSHDSLKLFDDRILVPGHHQVSDWLCVGIYPGCCHSWSGYKPMLSYYLGIRYYKSTIRVYHISSTYCHMPKKTVYTLFLKKT